MFYLKEDIEKIELGLSEEIKILRGKTILLTGGCGFLGKYFIEIFNHINHNNNNKIKLIVVDNTSLKNFTYLKNKYKNFKFINQNVCKKINIKNKIDIIVHAAGIASPFFYRKKPLETLEVAVNGTKNCLELAKKNKSKFVFFSSSEIYGDPDISKIPIKEDYRGNVSSMGPRACYDESKRVGETLCYIYQHKYNLKINIIRPFNVYGPGMGQKDYRILPNFIDNILNKRKLKVYGTGKQTRTYCYITDAMIGFLKVIVKGKSGEVYNIGNNKPEISVFDLFKLLKKIYPKRILFQKIDYPKSYPEDEPQRRCPDITKAKKQLKFKPNIKLEKGLNNFIKWAKYNYSYK